MSWQNVFIRKSYPHILMIVLTRTHWNPRGNTQFMTAIKFPKEGDYNVGFCLRENNEVLME